MESQTYKTITQTLQDKYKYQFFKIIQSPSGVNNNSGNKLRTYAKTENQLRTGEVPIRGLIPQHDARNSKAENQHPQTSNWNR